MYWDKVSNCSLYASKALIFTDSDIIKGICTNVLSLLAKSLALIELKSMLATILRTYTVELPVGSNPADMEPIFAAIIRPQAEKCELIFRPIVAM